MSCSRCLTYEQEVRVFEAKIHRFRGILDSLKYETSSSSDSSNDGDDDDDEDHNNNHDDDDSATSVDSPFPHDSHDEDEDEDGHTTQPPSQPVSSGVLHALLEREAQEQSAVLARELATGAYDVTKVAYTDLRSVQQCIAHTLYEASPNSVVVATIADGLGLPDIIFAAQYSTWQATYDTYDFKFAPCHVLPGIWGFHVCVTLKTRWRASEPPVM